MSVEGAVVSPAGAGSTVNADNPWPGLIAFREGDQGYFQGRQLETEELLRVTQRERLVVLFSLSGLGKSSLLQAGLFPRLRLENVFPVYIRLDYSPKTERGGAKTLGLTKQVIAAIAGQAAAHKIEAPEAAPGESLWEYFHRAGNNFWNARNRPVMPLLVFDQFEEAFTLGRLDPERSAATETFLGQLADLAEGRTPAPLKERIDDHPDEAGAFNFTRHYYKILLSLREDFLADLDALRPSMPSVALNRMRLRRMNGEAALLVVSQAKDLIDADVAEQVVRFVAADKRQLPLADLEVEPALLSVVSRELNNRRRQADIPKITASLFRGNQEQVLTDFYERSIGDLPPEVRLFVEDHLLTVSGFRDSVALDNALSFPGVTREAIGVLVEGRLVRREDRGGSQRLELTHDLLAGVVRASRDNRHQREVAERERAALLATQEQQRLALLKAQEEDRQRLEEAQERERRERDRRELRRLRLMVVICAALTLAALGTTGWAIWAQGNAITAQRTAEDEKLNAQKSKKEIEKQLEQIKTQQKQIAISQTAIDFVKQQAAGPRPKIILYRQPTMEQVVPALKQLGYTDIKVDATKLNANIQDLPVDTLAYGCGVTNEDIRTIAVALSGAELPIRRITQAEKNPDPQLVQLIASARTRAMNLEPLSVSEIKTWTRPDTPCPP